MRVILIFWCCIASLSPIQAQIGGIERDFRTGYLDSLRSLDDLQYGEEPLEESTSPIIREPEEPTPREAPSNEGTLALLLIILAIIGFAGYVVLRQFSGRNKQVQESPVPIIDEAKAFRSTGFQAFIDQAESKKDWKTAFRYRYLSLLQQLERQGILDWHPHKTDETYLREIQDQTLRGQFVLISQAYAWIWYGKTGVSEAQYQQLLSFFHPISSSIRS